LAGEHNTFTTKTEISKTANWYFILSVYMHVKTIWEVQCAFLQKGLFILTWDASLSIQV
jgi:hypothetical protein